MPTKYSLCLKTRLYLLSMTRRCILGDAVTPACSYWVCASCSYFALSSAAVWYRQFQSMSSPVSGASDTTLDLSPFPKPRRRRGDASRGSFGGPKPPITPMKGSKSPSKALSPRPTLRRGRAFVGTPSPLKSSSPIKSTITSQSKSNVMKTTPMPKSKLVKKPATSGRLVAKTALKAKHTKRKKLQIGKNVSNKSMFEEDLASIRADWLGVCGFNRGHSNCGPPCLWSEFLDKVFGREFIHIYSMFGSCYLNICETYYIYIMGAVVMVNAFLQLENS